MKNNPVHRHICPVCVGTFNCQGIMCSGKIRVPHYNCASNNRFAQETRRFQDMRLIKHNPIGDKVPCHRCGHSHYSHYHVDKDNQFCKYCTCKDCQCIGCREDIKDIVMKNPPSNWHQEKIRIAKVYYNKDKKDKQFWLGYVKAHLKFMEIEQGGSEPDYEQYIIVFTNRYYKAKGELITYFAGARLAAVESRSGMIGDKYKKDLKRWHGV